MPVRVKLNNVSEQAWTSEGARIAWGRLQKGSARLAFQSRLTAPLSSILSGQNPEHIPTVHMMLPRLRLDKLCAGAVHEGSTALQGVQAPSPRDRAGRAGGDGLRGWHEPCGQPQLGPPRRPL